MCIRDSFDAAHKAFGFLMKAEVENGARVLKNPARPMTAIIGGAKVSDKIELISSLIDLCDTILIGCLLYTSDAADERSSVDLGGRRIIQKKKNKKKKEKRQDTYELS